MGKISKGQGAAEYLVIFSVALMVALVVVSVLGFFPGTSSDMQQKESKAYWSSLQPISITDAVQYSSGSGTSLQLVLENRAPAHIEITNLTLNSSSGGYWNSTRLYFAPGQIVQLNISSAPASCANRSGSSVEYAIQLVYDQEPLTGKFEAGLKRLVVQCS